jgi:hypothetical protein
MAEQKATPDRSASPADRYAVVDDEPRGLSQDVGDSLLKVLLELRK